MTSTVLVDDEDDDDNDNDDDDDVLTPFFLYFRIFRLIMQGFNLPIVC